MVNIALLECQQGKNIKNQRLSKTVAVVSHKLVEVLVKIRRAFLRFEIGPEIQNLRH